MDLFGAPSEPKPAGKKSAPLARRLSPRNLEEFIGQDHILGPGKLLRRAIEADRISSVVFYGPPGCGKTALARIIATRTAAQFKPLNAAIAGVPQVREIIKAAELNAGRKTIVFIDELHRFNKLQQDALLPSIENGTIILIGATTQNPFFVLNSALLSRSLIFQFEPLAPQDLSAIISLALTDKERGLGGKGLKIDGPSREFLIKSCEGDARRLLNALEIAFLTTEADELGNVVLSKEVIVESLQRKAMLYDQNEDEHYNTISAFIKSMRGSDPDATIYWMAKMLEGGEDPRFIARRIVICAAEDVGNADPQALILANAALQVSEFIGLPEAQLPLAQAALYVASAPKSNASTMAISNAREEVRKNPTQQVPKHLQDAHYSGHERLDRGVGYQYPHDHPDGYIKQEYMPKDIKFYNPVNRGYEKIIKERLEKLRNIKENAQEEGSGSDDQQ